MKLLIILLAVLTLLAVLVFRGHRFDPTTIRDQRVLVTGASTGIGEQLAYQYARLGARLVITARREELLLNVSRTCKDLGAMEVHFVAADMARSEERSKVIAFVEERLGGLDHLVLNHAILIDTWWAGSPENLTALEQIMMVNFLSYVDLASKALPMVIASRGRIGIVSSGFGQIATVRTSVYSSSKFALHGFFSSLRQELRHNDTGVSVTFVVLGPVATDTFMGLRDFHTFVSLAAAPDSAARVILKSVAQRHYSVRYDWKMQVLLLINDFFPDYCEDRLPSIVLNEEGMPYLSRTVLFIMSTL